MIIPVPVIIRYSKSTEGPSSPYRQGFPGSQKGQKTKGWQSQEGGGHSSQEVCLARPSYEFILYSHYSF